MFGEGHDDSIVRPGVEEALACRDMLAPAPSPPPLIALIKARIAMLRAIAAGCLPTPQLRRAASPPAPNTIR